MHFSNTLIAFFAAFATALPTAEPSDDPKAAYPPPGTVSIKDIKLSGSGCPQGSVASLLSDDGQTVTLGFDKYIASTGPGISAVEARKNCQVFFNLFYPQGWSYTVATTDYRGFIDQHQSCSTTLATTNFFSGDQNQMTSAISVTGALDANYLRTSRVATETLIWAKCGAKGPTFVTNSQVSVKCKDKKESAVAGVDSQVTKFQIKYFRAEG
ncbi:hypothetical protein BLS_009441 [Venturia inaequalis]|uniref:Gb n=1 Tax=Venturia inaequalis TaxID=5025 RepID=A0A8H3YM52_VENIN|nr:hypothetical protein BLS_009441 [Venturia inaequalis]